MADVPTAADGVVLRPLLPADLEAAHALSLRVHWPHRLVDWQLSYRFGSGLAAERDGELVGTALSWHWGAEHATIGLVIVDPRCQGRRVGYRMMEALLTDLPDRSVLLHATPDGRGLYERLGFVRTGEVRQHQGTALPAPLVAMNVGRRLRPVDQSDTAVLATLDAQARGMPRTALITELLGNGDAVVLVFCPINNWHK